MQKCSQPNRPNLAPTYHFLPARFEKGSRYTQSNRLSQEPIMRSPRAILSISKTKGRVGRKKAGGGGGAVSQKNNFWVSSPQSYITNVPFVPFVKDVQILITFYALSIFAFTIVDLFQSKYGHDTIGILES